MATTERSVLEYRIDINPDLAIPEDVAKLAVRVEISSDEISYATQIYLVSKDATEVFFKVPQDVDVELRYGFADDARSADNKPNPNISWSDPVSMRSLDSLYPIAPTVFGSVKLVSESKQQLESLVPETAAEPVLEETIRGPLTPEETSTIPPWVVFPIDTVDVTLVGEETESLETGTAAPEVPSEPIVEEVIVEEAAVEEAAVEEAAVEEVAVEEVAVEEVIVEEAAVEETPNVEDFPENAVVEDVPAVEPIVEEVVAEEVVAEEVAVEDVNGNEVAVDEPIVDEVPVEDVNGEIPAEEVPAAENEDPISVEPIAAADEAVVAEVTEESPPEGETTAPPSPMSYTNGASGPSEFFS